ncbi:MAG: hypothetical protein MZW92_59120 [Comamonadaceae bacterium]|nr:hypothetical protein [Comamonadaceae bacterium]
MLGGQPGGGRRLPGRQGAGRRVPRRAGHEGVARPGQRRPRPGGASGSVSADGGGRRMTLVGYGLVVLGVDPVRGRRTREYARPGARYRDLKARDANAARYRAWRGGPSSAGEEKTGASVAMAAAAAPGPDVGDRRAWSAWRWSIVGFILASG